ncbi:MAG: hypothetical protein EOO65_00810 [Methanosarcinales archaeon]|nr:MAG: hypothetical protein EOO65_00810 [Methanosarcinales archaeon]
MYARPLDALSRGGGASAGGIQVHKLTERTYLWGRGVQHAEAMYWSSCAQECAEVGVEQGEEPTTSAGKKVVRIEDDAPSPATSQPRHAFVAAAWCPPAMLLPSTASVFDDGAVDSVLAAADAAGKLHVYERRWAGDSSSSTAALQQPRFQVPSQAAIYTSRSKQQQSLQQYAWLPVLSASASEELARMPPVHSVTWLQPSSTAHPAADASGNSCSSGSLPRTGIAHLALGCESCIVLCTVQRAPDGVLLDVQQLCTLPIADVTGLAPSAEDTNLSAPVAHAARGLVAARVTAVAWQCAPDVAQPGATAAAACSGAGMAATSSYAAASQHTIPSFLAIGTSVGGVEVTHVLLTPSGPQTSRVASLASLRGHTISHCEWVAQTAGTPAPSTVAHSSSHAPSLLLVHDCGWSMWSCTAFSSLLRCVSQPLATILLGPLHAVTPSAAHHPNASGRVRYAAGVPPALCVLLSPIATAEAPAQSGLLTISNASATTLTGICALPSDGTARIGRASPMFNGLELSVLTASMDGEVRLWDVAAVVDALARAAVSAPGTAAQPLAAPGLALVAWAASPLCETVYCTQVSDAGSDEVNTAVEQMHGLAASPCRTAVNVVLCGERSQEQVGAARAFTRLRATYACLPLHAAAMGLASTEVGSAPALASPSRTSPVPTLRRATPCPAEVAAELAAHWRDCDATAQAWCTARGAEELQGSGKGSNLRRACTLPCDRQATHVPPELLAVTWRMGDAATMELIQWMKAAAVEYNKSAVTDFVTAQLLQAQARKRAKHLSAPAMPPVHLFASWQDFDAQHLLRCASGEDGSVRLSPAASTHVSHAELADAAAVPVVHLLRTDATADLYACVVRAAVTGLRCTSQRLGGRSDDGDEPTVWTRMPTTVTMCESFLPSLFAALLNDFVNCVAVVVELVPIPIDAGLVAITAHF